MKRTPCEIGKACAKHDGMVHGREAEELRAGLEALMVDDDVSLTTVLLLLERVDARDSLAYLESDRIRREKARKTT